MNKEELEKLEKLVKQTEANLAQLKQELLQVDKKPQLGDIVVTHYEYVDPHVEFLPGSDMSINDFPILSLSGNGLSSYVMKKNCLNPARRQTILTQDQKKRVARFILDMIKE